MDRVAPGIPVAVALSRTCPLSENMLGGDGEVGVEVNTMVSSPIGLRQQGAAEFVSATDSVSIASALWELVIVLNSPNVFGSVSASVNTVVAFLIPLIVYGIGVVLAYRSTDLK